MRRHAVAGRRAFGTDSVVTHLRLVRSRYMLMSFVIYGVFAFIWRLSHEIIPLTLAGGFAAVANDRL